MNREITSKVTQGYRSDHRLKFPASHVKIAHAYIENNYNNNNIEEF